MFFCIVIKSGNFPSSAPQAILVAFLFTPRYSLQNLRWAFSVCELSHLL